MKCRRKEERENAAGREREGRCRRDRKGEKVCEMRDETDSVNKTGYMMSQKMLADKTKVLFAKGK